MKNVSIKVIKRRDAEARAGEKTLPVSFAATEQKRARLLRRNIDSTVSLWVTERRKNNRAEKAAAVRKMLSGEILSAAG